MTEMSIAELEELLRVKRQEEADALKVKRDSVKPVYRITIDLATGHSFHKIMDDSVKVYRISGEVTNKAEVDAVGGDSRGGGMDYLFNTLSGKLIMSTGGGTIWVGGFDNDGHEAFQQINEFLCDHPDGGNITDIVNADRQARGLEESQI